MIVIWICQWTLVLYEKSNFHARGFGCQLNMQPSPHYPTKSVVLYLFGFGGCLEGMDYETQGLGCDILTTDDLFRRSFS